MILCPKTRLGPAAWAAFILAAALRPSAARPQNAPDSGPVVALGSVPGRAGAGLTASEYVVRARAFLLGDLGPVGTALFERRLERTGAGVVRTSRFSGRSTPEQAKRGRDIGGELTTVTCSPSAANGEPGSDPGEPGGWTAASCSWFLASNGVPKSENITFYPDHALSVKDNGSENRLDGRFESLLSWLEYFLENPFRPGDVHHSRFILDGRPYLFKCEVGPPEVLEPCGVEAHRIDLTMYDGRRLDGSGNPRVVKKKGAIRLWLSQEGERRDEFLRLRVQYKWYLTLVFDRVETPGRFPTGPGLAP